MRDKITRRDNMNSRFAGIAILANERERVPGDTFEFSDISGSDRASPNSEKNSRTPAFLAHALN
jgi:hypothetical protein